MEEESIKVGMYVRCSVDVEDADTPRRFAVGQVCKLFEDEVVVDFYFPDRLENLGEVYFIPDSRRYRVEQVKPIRILPRSPVTITRTNITALILSYSHSDQEGIKHYYVKGRNATAQLLSEQDLRIPFNRGDVDVCYQAFTYEFQNPKFYLHRERVAETLHYLNNAAFGFETLIGTRVFLMDHQVDTIMRSIAQEPCRIMLADEVGLGKTIEALVILKGLKRKKGRLKTLFLVPESILSQWKNELDYKFWLDVKVYKPGQPLLHDQDLFFPLEQIGTAVGRQVAAQSWDALVVDEAHRLLYSSDYPLVKQLSQMAEHVLLLSATPIQSRHQEFLKLVTLLDPQKYCTMSLETFKSIVEKQEYLHVKLYRLFRDLQDDFDEDVAEEVIDELEEISEKLGDATLLRLVREIDIEGEDVGLAQIKFVLAYLSEHYQIERKIIRHRRREKELSGQLPKRISWIIPYVMKGADEGFYERETYEALLDYLEEIKETEHADTFTLQCLQAIFSSPWALKNVLRSSNRAMSEQLAQVYQLNDRWRRETVAELNDWQEKYDYPDTICGRYGQVINYIMEETRDEKLVLFSTFKESILPLEEVLIKIYGEQAVRCFYHGKSADELQQTVDDFQSKPECRFLLCDEYGGEGRNFQMADQVLHLDLPWSPVTVEQRIGRLDRIGREKDVLSVVFHTEDTLENDLYDILNQGMNIFEESLSGLEIAIRDIQQEMMEAMQRDIRYGLREAVPSIQHLLKRMWDRVEEERLFDMAKQYDPHVKRQLSDLIHLFDGQEGALLSDVMLSWASMTGLRSRRVDQGRVVQFVLENTSIGSMRKTKFIPPNMDETHKRSRRKGQLSGTFLRSYSVLREDLMFYAPGDPFFDSIVNNAYELDAGRMAAMEIRGLDLNWEGFIFSWSVAADANPLLRLGKPLEYLALTQGYVPLEPQRTYETLRSDTEVDPREIHSVLDSAMGWNNTIHLGKRGNHALAAFQEQYPPDIWANLFQRAFENSKSTVQQKLQQEIRWKKAEQTYQKSLNAKRASVLYYGIQAGEDREIRDLQSIHQALVEGLRNPTLRLDSVAYVRLVKRDES